MKLVVKSGIAQLDWFKRKNFPFYEAYIRCDDNLQQLLYTEMKLISIHMPSTVETSSGKKTVNFCDEGELGDVSFAYLEKLIKFCQINTVNFIVIHLGFFNSFLEDRFTILENVAKRFEKYTLQRVTLCLENVPCWTNISFDNEPIISEVEHFLYFKECCPSIGLTFDVDHLAITTVFNEFYGQFKKDYVLSSNKVEFRMMMERSIMTEVKDRPDFFANLVHRKIVDFISKVQPDTVHAVGSDFCHYHDCDQLPLVGEALPLGYKGMINNYFVEDRIDHARWVRLLKNDLYITIELMMRSDYDYIEQIEKSIYYLNSL